MTHITCRLTAKNWDQLQNPTLGNSVWATFFNERLASHTTNVITLLPSPTFTNSAQSELRKRACTVGEVINQTPLRPVIINDQRRLCGNDDQPAFINCNIYSTLQHRCKVLSFFYSCRILIFLFLFLELSCFIKKR